MSQFTEIFVTKVVKIKDIIHSVLKSKFFKIYLSIFKLLKEKKVNWFFRYQSGEQFQN